IVKLGSDLEIEWPTFGCRRDRSPIAGGNRARLLVSAVVICISTSSALTSSSCGLLGVAAPLCDVVRDLRMSLRACRACSYLRCYLVEKRFSSARSSLLRAL